MNITRHNYEEYFILYLDNELGIEDRQRVELFVKEHPDLQGELNLLLQAQLVPNGSFVFNGKEELFKPIDSSSIDSINYEEWLLSYTDNELSAEQKTSVERFISSHPGVKAELDIFKNTKLQADPAVVFFNKEILYRKEEKVRVIGMRWRKIAAAAALLFAVSATALILFNNRKDNPHEIVSAPVKQNITKKTPIIEQSNNEIPINTQDEDNAIDKIEKETPAKNDQLVKEKKRPQEKAIPHLPAEVKNEDVATGNKEKKNMNGLPQPTHNPNVNKIAEQENPIASNLPVKESLTISKENKQTPSVTPTTTQPLDHVITATSIEVDDERPGKKNKLRGFFRKVTRTFEKNTNIKATDDEDRLLLGGLAIKL
jgi:hypothetical protein